MRAALRAAPPQRGGQRAAGVEYEQIILAQELADAVEACVGEPPRHPLNDHQTHLIARYPPPFGRFLGLKFRRESERKRTGHNPHHHLIRRPLARRFVAGRPQFFS